MENTRKLSLGRFHLLQPFPLKAVAAPARIPFHTPQRWVALYRQLRLTALARKNRPDTGWHVDLSARLKDATERSDLQKPYLPARRWIENHHRQRFHADWPNGGTKCGF
jgi:hypothetical protein